MFKKGDKDEPIKLKLREVIFQLLLEINSKLENTVLSKQTIALSTRANVTALDAKKGQNNPEEYG